MLPDHKALKALLQEAFSVYLQTTDVSHAVGQHGRLTVALEIHLDGGRPRWTKGAVGFERRIDMQENRRGTTGME